MSASFHVSVSEVTRLARTFAERQQIPADLGGPLRQSAGGMRTGDPALDAEARQLFDQYQALLDGVRDAFDYTAGALTDVADASQRFDEERAAEQREQTGIAHG
ncbi:hypothetical protein [Actinophytocola sp.]|uniref:hypothetical protein n=1 Tax=Actinophytocola sp. TaxID=1872138 RepID=UPI002ED5FA5C